MPITRTQTKLGKSFPALDQNVPGYNRLENSVQSDDLHPATIQYAEVAISIAQLKVCRATPITLVAAPGAGYLTEFISATFIYDYVAAYTESAANLEVRFTNGSGAVASTVLETTGLLDATSDQVRTFKAVSTDITPVADAALVLFNNGAGEFGSTGSPCRVKVAYRVHATGL